MKSDIYILESNREVERVARTGRDSGMGYGYSIGVFINRIRRGRSGVIRPSEWGPNG